MALFTTRDSQATLWLVDGHVVWRGEVNPFNAPQRIGAATIVAGVCGDVCLKTPTGSLRGPGFILPAHHPYQIAHHRSEVLLIYLDASHTLARGVHRAPFKAHRVDAVNLRNLLDIIGESDDPALLRTGISDGLAKISPVSSERVDWRVERALDRLRQDPGSIGRLEDLSAGVRLSDERLRHLIRDALGVPFTRYRSWRKLYGAMAHLTQGHDITSAAHEADFSDSAHLARTFKGVFRDSITGRLLRRGRPIAQGYWLDPGGLVS